jgi:hypothetical protein
MRASFLVASIGVALAACSGDGADVSCWQDSDQSCTCSLGHWEQPEGVCTRELVDDDDADPTDTICCAEPGWGEEAGRQCSCNQTICYTFDNFCACTSDATAALGASLVESCVPGAPGFVCCDLDAACDCGTTAERCGLDGGVVVDECTTADARGCIGDAVEVAECVGLQ